MASMHLMASTPEFSGGNFLVTSMQIFTPPFAVRLKRWHVYIRLAGGSGLGPDNAPINIWLAKMTVSAPFTSTITPSKMSNRAWAPLSAFSYSTTSASVGETEIEVFDPREVQPLHQNPEILEAEGYEHILSPSSWYVIRVDSGRPGALIFKCKMEIEE